MKTFLSKFRLPILALILATLVITVDHLTEQAIALYLQDSEGFKEVTPFFNLVWLLQTTSLLVSLALGLIIGGALGNTFERLIYGNVIDVLDFYVYGYHWPAF